LPYGRRAFGSFAREKGKGKNDPANSLLDRNNAAGNDKDAMFLRHDAPLMAANKTCVKQTILFMPH
jgi:hypothetical protein